jgi:hypothetical protein
MLSWRKSLLVAAVACTSALRVGVSPRVAPAVGHAESASRRDALFGGLAALALPAAPALAKIESVNPGNNYYFPMAKYRYLPRILRSWIAVDQLAPTALKSEDWDGLEEVWRRLDDTTTALPLYTSAVEGSRSTKRKKKSDAQKQLMKDQKTYSAAVEDLKKAIDRKNVKKTGDALAVIKDSLGEYRQIAQIDKEDGGVISLPEGNPQEAGHGGAPLGYVVPALRGGGVKKDIYKLETVKSSDYALR